MNDIVKPWDMINGSPRATDEEAVTRLKICKSCPELIKLTTQCKKCGCFMSAKTKLQAAKCPIGKW
jgi:hypothetical protein